MNEVTFGAFAKLAAKRNLSQEFLSEHFRGKIENPAEFFHRVMEGRYQDVVIPYRSVLAFYAEELHYLKDSNPKRRRKTS